MEKKYESLTIFEFQAKFKDDDDCYQHLFSLKWRNGYSCSKCGNKKSCAGNKKYDLQCTKCCYVESTTAGTLFHKLKFSIHKAFYIIYYVSTSKKGISSTELSRKLGLRQKTCWLFKQKVMKAMESSGNHPLMGSVDVDETYVGGQDPEALGRNEGKKKIAVMAIEKRGKGVSRMYGKVIPTAEKKHLIEFIEKVVDKNAVIRTDGWNGYRGLEKEYKNHVRERSEKKGKNFKEMHRTIMMFKAWLRGVHHSVRNLQAYLDEYSYRFNRQQMKGDIFENLLLRMVLKEPYPYKLIIS